MARLLDKEGQVDRFYRRLQARQDYIQEQEARVTERVSPERPISELKISKRAADVLVKAGLKTAGDVLDKLAEGEQAMLDVEGFGRKSLIDLKKSLRQFGYEDPISRRRYCGIADRTNPQKTRNKSPSGWMGIFC